MALTKFNYNSFDVTPVASAGLAFNSGANGLTSLKGTSQVLIKTITASNDSTISFVDGSSDVVLDNTYPVYLFKFINLHTANDDVHLKVNFSADTGSNYNVTKTSTYFKTYHAEDDSGTASVAYDDGHDIAQGTGAMSLRNDAGNANDESSSGELWLFNPSSTTYVKHFIYRLTCNQRNDAASENFGTGYCNTTSAVDAVQFSVSGGNYDSGTFKLYGIKDS
jgi:hypothetical protein